MQGSNFFQNSSSSKWLSSWGEGWAKGLIFKERDIYAYTDPVGGRIRVAFSFELLGIQERRT